MPSTPLNFRGRSGPTRPLSHERFLEVCYAYKTIYEAFVRNGGEVTSKLYEATLRIETEIIHWEQRSAKLRYAAKRQALYRADKRDKLEGGGDFASFDAATDTFIGHADPDEPSSADLPEATQAALDKFREEHDARNKAPDTSGYKKSGLV